VFAAARGAALGVGGRRPVAGALRDRRRHATMMPWVLALILLSWAGGVASVWWLRDDISVADSAHFTVGTAIVAAFVAAALVSRRIDVDGWSRRVHPWIGAAALLLCGWQVFLGLQLMPR